MMELQARPLPGSASSHVRTNSLCPCFPLPPPPARSWDHPSLGSRLLCAPPGINLLRC